MRISDWSSDVCSSDLWPEIVDYLCSTGSRRAKLERNTKETKISLFLDLDGTGTPRIDTGLKFYDHMLDQLVKHSGVDLQLTVKGDLEVDEHHTIEDSAIALGQAFRQALGDKRGISRYGFLLRSEERRVGKE